MTNPATNSSTATSTIPVAHTTRRTNTGFALGSSAIHGSGVPHRGHALVASSSGTPQSRHVTVEGLGAGIVVRYLAIFTSVTALTRLLASTKSPSRVTDVLRTMLPPPGMAQL